MFELLPVAYGTVSVEKLKKGDARHIIGLDLSPFVDGDEVVVLRKEDFDRLVNEEETPDAT